MQPVRLDGLASARMPEFLSDEWIAALAGACRARPAVAEVADGADAADGAPPLTIEPVVRAVPGRGEVRYRIRIADRAPAVEPVRPGDAPAQVELHTDYETSVALARGETNAQAALAQGRLRLAGDLSCLAAHAGDLARLDDLFAAVRASTSYPAPPARTERADRSDERP